MNIGNYKIMPPIDSRASLLLLPSNNDMNENPENISFDDNAFNDPTFIAFVEHHIDESNLHFNQKNIKPYENSLYQIVNLLNNKFIPNNCLTLQRGNFFQNILQAYLINVENEKIIKYSTQILNILSSNYEICHQFDELEFFQIIEKFISPYNSKFRLRRISQEYSYDLIGVLRNFACYREFHSKFTPSMILYTSNAIQNAYSMRSYQFPMMFFETYTSFPIEIDENVNPSEKQKCIAFRNSLILPIYEIIGWFCASPQLVTTHQTEQSGVLAVIHQSAAHIIFNLIKNKNVIMKQFFGYDKAIVSFIKHFFLVSKYLVMAVGLFAYHYPDQFDLLGILPSDFVDAFKKGKDVNSGEDYLKFTCYSLIHVIEKNRNVVEGNQEIHSIIEFLVMNYDGKEYLTKYFMFLLLCEIYSYLPFPIYNEDYILFILDESPSFISENNGEATQLIIPVIKRIHEYIEINNKIEKYIDPFNECVQSILSNSECNDRDQISIPQFVL
ncbi:hypothetical protein TRFO_16842 [Tritrichomonas foetus]|uniref:Uncharacterized protein n=1 Tax=Tritrichomonas foetus TaxID=1144522 RepID=A0A1J4KPE1_9EUKA|nr:hypothetical protein TRFO_16842 [Tritrichomonas foetus]|eukprot:OHT13169.1 hypothetical protein TRFO_16842 [Tritrichomonas foetus]